MIGVNICRICGCTDTNACVTEAGACWWANGERDICSACVEEEVHEDSNNSNEWKPNWKMAESYLYEMKSAYESIGWAGSFGLTPTINPLVERYKGGERTIELYNEIIELQ